MGVKRRWSDATSNASRRSGRRAVLIGRQFRRGRPAERIGSSHPQFAEQAPIYVSLWLTGEELAHRHNQRKSRVGIASRDECLIRYIVNLEQNERNLPGAGGAGGIVVRAAWRNRRRVYGMGHLRVRGVAYSGYPSRRYARHLGYRQLTYWPGGTHVGSVRKCTQGIQRTCALQYASGHVRHTQSFTSL